MQRGAKIALASAIVLSGWVGASLFRKPPQAPEEKFPHKSDRPALRLPLDESGSARLSGQIEPVEEPAKPTAAVAEPTFEAEPLDSGHGRRKTMPSTWEQAVASETREPSLGPAAPAASRFQLHRIRDGDTLSSLARDYLGSSKRFMEIYEANLDRLSSPDLLPIGDELKIPPADCAARSAASEDDGQRRDYLAAAGIDSARIDPPFARPQRTEHCTHVPSPSGRHVGDHCQSLLWRRRAVSGDLPGEPRAA